jgi:hypothetical protein
MRKACSRENRSARVSVFDAPGAIAASDAETQQIINETWKKFRDSLAMLV